MRSAFQHRMSSLWVFVQDILPVLLAIVVGAATGMLALVASGASSKWEVAVLVILAAFVATLLVGDIRKIVLLAFVVDMALGLDIALQDQEWHLGGPTGYMISLMTIALVAGYAIWIMEKRPRPRFFAGTTIPALLYLFMVVLSLLQSSNLQLSLFGVFLQFQFLLMYFYLANHVRTQADLRLIVLGIMACLLFESVLMLIQYFAGVSFSVGAIASYSVDSSASAGASGPRVGGTIGSPNSAAAYLAPMLVLTFSAYLTGKLVDTRLALLAFVLGTVALIATATRTAWGSLILAMLILLSYVIRTEAAGKALWFLSVGGLIVGLLFGGQIAERIAAVATDRTRPELATMAYNIIEAFPLGIGENNYDQVMGDRYAHPNWVGHTHYPVHNKYLLVWAETGIQGLVAFVLFLLAAMWQARHWFFRGDVDRRLGIMGAGLLSALAGYAFHMATEGFSSRANVQILWFVVAILVAVTQLLMGAGPAGEGQESPGDGGVGS